jgi:very-short-patch-repair endonuclease
VDEPRATGRHCGIVSPVSASPTDLTLLADLRRPVTRADALAAGVSPSMIKGSRFRRIFRGVYISASVPPDALHRVAGALLLHPPTAFASHLSAARVYGVPLPALSDEHVSVFRAADRRSRPGLCTHVAAADTEVRTVQGLRVSVPAQMFVELAGLLSLVDLVVVGDALCRLRLATPATLVTAAGASRSTRAITAASYVRAEVDSAMETRLRMLIVLAGLPEPRVNHVIRDAYGVVLLRFDLSYPDLRIVVEYDGRQHRDDLDQWDHDQDRKDWFDAEGWLHVPVFSRGIYRDPAKTLRRVEAALRSRGAVLPRRLSDDWRAHFPTR